MYYTNNIHMFSLLLPQNVNKYSLLRNTQNCDIKLNLILLCSTCICFQVILNETLYIIVGTAELTLFLIQVGR